MPRDVKETAYKGPVRPVLEYGSSAWGLRGVVLQEELESLQKRAAWFVSGNYNYDIQKKKHLLRGLQRDKTQSSLFIYRD